MSGGGDGAGGRAPLGERVPRPLARFHLPPALSSSPLVRFRFALSRDAAARHQPGAPPLPAAPRFLRGSGTPRSWPTNSSLRMVRTTASSARRWSPGRSCGETSRTNTYTGSPSRLSNGRPSRGQREGADEPVGGRVPGVGDGDAAADAGGAQLLAAEDGADDLVPRRSGRTVAGGVQRADHLAHHRFLHRPHGRHVAGRALRGGRRQRRDDRVADDEIAQAHRATSSSHTGRRVVRWVHRAVSRGPGASVSWSRSRRGPGRGGGPESSLCSA